MKIHLFEFRSDKKQLKCLCGWQRTMKSVDAEAAHERFNEHVAEAGRTAK